MGKIDMALWMEQGRMRLRIAGISLTIWLAFSGLAAESQTDKVPRDLSGGLAVGRSKQTCELTSSVVPRGTSFHRLVELEFPPTSDLAGCSRYTFPCPSELGAINPDNGMDRPRSYRVNGNAAEAQLIRERSAP
jgi:hypothetical protein